MDYCSEDTGNSYSSDFLAAKKAVAVLVAAETSETSEIAKRETLTELDIALAVVEEVASTTAVRTLATATVAIS